MSSRPFYRNSLQVNIVVSWASENPFSKKQSKILGLKACSTTPIMEAL